MLISPHFDLDEFTQSQVATRWGRDIVPPSDVIGNIELLCHQILEPLRLLVQRPIIITSGYRPDWLNRAIGGSEHSAHMYGCAADIICPGMVALGVASRVGMMHAAKDDTGASLLPTLDQCILEFGRWTHVAIARPKEKPRGEFLTARLNDANRVYYELGLRP